MVLGRSDTEAQDKAHRLAAGPGTIVGGPQRVADALLPYVEAGAQWLVLGPVDSSDPVNAAIVADALAPLLA